MTMYSTEPCQGSVSCPVQVVMECLSMPTTASMMTTPPHLRGDDLAEKTKEIAEQKLERRGQQHHSGHERKAVHAHGHVGRGKGTPPDVPMNRTYPAPSGPTRRAWRTVDRAQHRAVAKVT